MAMLLMQWCHIRDTTSDLIFFTGTISTGRYPNRPNHSGG
jgi:hypothetical protein